MPLRALLAAALAATLLLPPPVAAASEAPEPEISIDAPGGDDLRQRRLPMHVDDDDVEDAAAWAVAARDAAAATTEALLTQVSGGSAERYDYLLRAGDFDGDGLPDLIQVRQQRGTATGLAGLTGGPDPWVMHVQARRGLTGTQLWSFTEQGAVTAALPLDRGGVTDGVLLATYDILGLDTGSAAGHSVTLRLTALDHTGAISWTQSFDGTISQAGNGTVVGTGLPLFAGRLEGPTGTDLLVETVDFVYQSGVIYAYGLETTVLRGSNGLVVSSAEHLVPETEPGAEPVAVPVGDLSGNSRDDYVVAAGVSDASPARVVARASTDGRELWSTTEVPIQGRAAVDRVGDVTGDGRHDLAFAVSTNTGTQLHLVRGRDGTVAWYRHGSVAYRLGDVTGNGIAETGIARLTYVNNRLAWRFEAVQHRWGPDGGVTVLSTEHALPNIQGTIGLETVLRFAGDVLNDGVTDVAVHLGAKMPGGAAEVRIDRLVAGATGNKIRPLQNERPLRGSVDRNGDDFFRVRLLHSGWAEVTVLDGASGAPLWGTEVGAGTVLSGLTVAPLDVTGDGRSDLVFSARRDPGFLVAVLRGLDGTRLW